MGREIRRVPPNWEHPRWTKDDARYQNSVGSYRPCHDSTYEEAAGVWLKQNVEWEAGTHPNREKEEKYGCRYFWEWHGMPPEEELHRPAFDAEPTWFQVYETVSEGTPVSPPFATKEELVDYLVDGGDEWCRSRGDPPPSREAAVRFVEDEFAMSMVVVGGQLKVGIDSCDMT